jgi:hypothetical protein
MSQCRSRRRFRHSLLDFRFSRVSEEHLMGTTMSVCHVSRNTGTGDSIVEPVVAQQWGRGVIVGTHFCTAMTSDHIGARMTFDATMTSDNITARRPKEQHGPLMTFV